MAFSLGCFACCVPCDPCDAACDETPDEAFAVVYQVEDDRANLTWTGDAMGPIDGPWPGFESGGSFSQTITSNNVLLPGSRFPCYFRLKLWRNVGGGEGSESLTSQRVTISCTQGKLNLGFVVLNAGESVEFTTVPESSTATYVFESTPIALDENGGDRHAHPPTEWQVSGGALCADTVVSVQASIAWSNDLIQHNLYGEFVECFTESNSGGDCVIDCDGTLTEYPSDITVEITNASIAYTLPPGSTATFPSINGTYVLPRGSADPYCRAFFDSFAVTNGTFDCFIEGSTLSAAVSGFPFTPQRGIQFGFVRVTMTNSRSVEDLVCGVVGSISGSATMIVLDANAGGGGQNVEIGTIDFDYEVTL